MRSIIPDWFVPSRATVDGLEKIRRNFDNSMRERFQKYNTVMRYNPFAAQRLFHKYEAQMKISRALWNAFNDAFEREAVYQRVQWNLFAMENREVLSL